ncbi:ATP-binding protein [Streptomyces sp. 2A115]|uniref:ATP-binding protein n=1 Tax=Streptomyces sp. 2A115 TaxID=3457439 RepID=UPI003FD007CA
MKNVIDRVGPQHGEGELVLDVVVAEDETLLIAVTDPSPQFPDFLKAVSAQKSTGLSLIRELGGESTWRPAADEHKRELCAGLRPPSDRSCIPPEDVMTTTALRTPRAVTRRGSDVMNERFKVAPGCGDASPRREDACRVGIMRRIAAARLRYCGLDAMADEVMVIVSELLTNALVHSGTTEISLSICVQDGFLRIAVGDGMAGSAEPEAAGETAESGRGLMLVEALVRESGGTWGTSDGGATTWCCLTVPGEDGDVPLSGATRVRLRLVDREAP